jgi:hypothetical protein
MLVEHEGQVMRPAALVEKMENSRPLCRVCGSEMSRGRELCIQCEPGYEAACRQKRKERTALRLAA